MNEKQVIITILYIILTIGIVLCQTKYGETKSTIILSLVSRILMVLTLVYLLWSKSLVYDYLCLIISFIFTVVSDYLFKMKELKKNKLYTVGGIAGFVFAYLFLIFSFKGSVNLCDMLYAYGGYMIPFLLIFACIFYNLKQYVSNKIVRLLAIGFGIVLSCAAWSLVTLAFRGFSLDVSLMAAEAGIIIFFSDMCVAYSIFCPAFEKFNYQLENIVWGTYMIGWTLLLLMVADNSFCG